MMRIFLALGGALVLSACAGGDRVTLLAPIQAEKLERGEFGAVAVLDPGAAALSPEEYALLNAEQTDLEVIDAENEQALLGRRNPRVRELTEANAAYADLMASLPVFAQEIFQFGNNASELSEAQLNRLQAFLDPLVGLPGIQIEIAAYSDSPGDETYNFDLSESRAKGVAQQVVGRGFTIEEGDIVGGGEYRATEDLNGGAERPQPEWRIVVVTVR